MDHTTFLNLDDLYATHIKKDKNKLKLYEDIYKKCIQKIQKTNTERQELTCCFTVPIYVFGGPKLDYDELKRYLLFKLHSNGVYAEFLDNKTLFISWKPEDINRQKYENGLRKLKKRIESKFNVIESNVAEKTIKHRKNGRDNVTSNTTQVGVLQYNDKIKDLVPINPQKLHKFKPLSNFPLVPRANHHDIMMNSRQMEQMYPTSNYVESHVGNYLNNPYYN